MTVADNGLFRLDPNIVITRYLPTVLNVVVVGAASQRAGKRGVMYARQALRAGGHNDTGRLSASLKSRVTYTDSGPMFTVYSDIALTDNKPVAVWVNDGTIGPIYPTSAKVLVFPPGKRSAGNPVIFRPSVSGQVATRFMDKALARLRISDFQ